MSLINEALRKARQAASEHESNRADDPFRPTRAYPSRRSSQNSHLLAVVLIAVVVGAIGASTAWWYFGSRQARLPETASGEPAPIVATSTVETPPPSPATEIDQTVLLSAHADVAEAPTPQFTPAADPSPALREAEAEPAHPDETPDDPVQPTDGEREFVVEANLGYASLSLGYIVARREDSFAEINGVEVYIGSEIEGFVVEAIEAERVVLRDDRGTVVLRVP